MQRRARHPLGRTPGAERSPAAVRGEVLGRRQRDVGQMAARLHGPRTLCHQAELGRGQDAEVDPNIFCISSGNPGPWSTGLLKQCVNHMDSIAEHFYCQERPDLLAHVLQIPGSIRSKAEFHRKAGAEMPNLRGHDIRIAMTEWNYWYGPHLFGELGTRYFLADALGIAAGVHEYAGQSDLIHSAFYAQTVDVIGAIKVSRRNAAFETTELGPQTLPASFRRDSRGHPDRGDHRRPGRVEQRPQDPHPRRCERLPRTAAHSVHPYRCETRGRWQTP